MALQYTLKDVLPIGADKVWASNGYIFAAPEKSEDGYFRAYTYDGSALSEIATFREISVAGGLYPIYELIYPYVWVLYPASPTGMPPTGFNITLALYEFTGAAFNHLQSAVIDVVWSLPYEDILGDGTNYLHIGHTALQELNTYRTDGANIISVGNSTPGIGIIRGASNGRVFLGSVTTAPNLYSMEFLPGASNYILRGSVSYGTGITPYRVAWDGLNAHVIWSDGGPLTKLVVYNYDGNSFGPPLDDVDLPYIPISIMVDGDGNIQVPSDTLMECYSFDGASYTQLVSQDVTPYSAQSVAELNPFIVGGTETKVYDFGEPGPAPTPPPEPENLTRRYWVSGVPADFSDPAAWSESSGGPGGATAPDSTDFTGVFDMAGSGTCQFNSLVLTGGLHMKSPFDGIVDQNGKSIYLGADGLYAAMGTFQGSSEDIEVEGTAYVGTSASFQSTDGTLSCSGAAYFDPGGMDTNNGTVSLKTGAQLTGNAVSFYNLQIDGTATVDGTCTATNTVTLKSGVLQDGSASLVIATKDVHVLPGFGSFGASNKGLISMEGSGAQFLINESNSSTADAVIPSLRINKTDTTQVVCQGVGPIQINQDFILQDGTFNTKGFNLRVGE